MNRSTPDDGRHELDGIDLPSNAYELGVDTTGATHYHSALAHQVWVVADSELTHTFDVDDIDHYVAHVADTRGWDDVVDTDTSLVDLVIETVEQSGGEVSA